MSPSSARPSYPCSDIRTSPAVIRAATCCQRLDTVNSAVVSVIPHKGGDQRLETTELSTRPILSRVRWIAWLCRFHDLRLTRPAYRKPHNEGEA